VRAGSAGDTRSDDGATRTRARAATKALRVRMSTNSRTPGTDRLSLDGDDLVSGEMLGRYQLTALLASGGMGQVWAARATGSGLARTVALKVVRSEMSDDENYARMFIDEATLAASIRHPNVAEIYELGKHKGRLFMAMEWVDGDSLAGLMRHGVGEALSAFDARIAARIIADACAGLHAAHETVGPDGALLGVVHRDISPPNILISSRGQAKVTDFGIAKARFQMHERTKTGEIKGKLAYIPPEQFENGALDRRADIYAMGCVLYVATTGLKPFGNGAAALSKILHNEYKTPRALFPDYSEQLEAVVVKALALEPSDRFATAEEMQLAIEEWLVASGKVTTATDVAKAVKERVSPEMRARNEALISQSRTLPEAMMSRLVADYDSNTPTAGSGLINAPPGLQRRRSSGPRPTFVSTARSEEPTQTAASTTPARNAPTERPVRTTDATGVVKFTPLGADTNTAPVPASGLKAALRKPAVAILLGLLVVLALLGARWLFRG
jgi:serine/threonine protein kinase